MKQNDPFQQKENNPFHRILGGKEIVCKNLMISPFPFHALQHAVHGTVWVQGFFI